MKRLGWLLLGALLMAGVLVAVGFGMVLSVDRGVRGPAPPAGVKASYPWGAMDLDELQTDPQSGLQRSIADSIRAERPETFDRDQDGIREYDLLALSGGGSSGAFGAGFLCGWTKSGTRPDFKVVTGVSTGCLQATFAFLGPDYDDELKAVYTEVETEDIHVKRDLLAGIFNDALRDTAPLKRLIDRYMTRGTLEAVAAKHAAGHRLFVGTTNMDTGDFVVWDMGAIASSGRPDALEHYRRVLLASTSIPVLFPPVYFEVEANGRTYHEMHADGSTYTQVFFRGFLLDFDDAFDDAGIDESKIDFDIYVLRNGKEFEGDGREEVGPRTLSIAQATIENLFRITISTGLYRIYVLANRYGIDFNLAQVPADYPHELDAVEFDREEMGRLFKLGYDLAAQGYEWSHAPADLDPDEIFRKDTDALAGAAQLAEARR
ncbi:MAG: patatin-like phospholipase family protein [Phycisphaerales bacterium]|nr:MAG: patatin-like phospholipase family protein [Phycisphaerales bacterium]